MKTNIHTSSNIVINDLSIRYDNLHAYIAISRQQLPNRLVCGTWDIIWYAFHGMNFLVWNLNYSDAY